MVGIYWINHHDLIRRIETVDYRVLWSNLIFLFVLSLIPYFVEYLDEKSFDSFSTVLYDVVMLLAGAAFFLLRRAVMRRQRQSGSLHTMDLKELWKHDASLVMYLVSIGVALYKPALSLSIVALVTVIWIVPSAGVKHHAEQG